MKQKINAYVNDKALPPFAYAFLTVLLSIYFITFVKLYGQDPPWWLFMLGSFNLGIHELGHLITGFLPEIITVASGSGFEIIFVLLVLYACVKKRCYFAAGATLIWLSLTFYQVARYVADARAQALPLVSLGNLSGEAPTGDWTIILGRFNLLQQDLAIARTLRALGIIVGLLGIFFCAYLVIKMFTAEEENNDKKLHADTLPKSTSIYPTPIRDRLADPPEDKTSNKAQAK